MRRYIKNNLILGSLFLLMIIILVLPSAIRWSDDNPMISDGEFYQDIRTSKDLSKDIYWDSLESRVHKASLFYYIQSNLLFFIGLEAMIVVAIIFGALSLMFFFLIIKEFFKEKRVQLISCFLLILSPIFIYLFSKPSISTFATLFSLAFLYFYIKKSYWSVPFLMLVSVTDFSFFLANITLMITYNLYDKNTKLFLINLIPSIISLTIFFLLHSGFQLTKNLFIQSSLQQFFTSFGSNLGIAFFYLFLGIIGFFTIWRRKKELVYLLMSTIIVFLFSIFNATGKIFLNFFLSLFASLLIVFLLKRKWALPVIKRFTLLLIFCGIIFSTAVHVDEVINSEPKNDLLLTLQKLKSEDQGVVLSHEIYGHYIEYYSKKRTFIDDYSMNYKGFDDLKSIQKQIFESRSLELTQELIEENNLEYFLVTPEMKKGMVWKREGEGFLFLLENSKSFKNLAINNGFSLWEYIG